LRVHGLCDELVLDYLSADGVADYLANRFGDVSFSTTFSRDLHQRTNGNPLFLVNVVNAMVQQGVFQEGDSSGNCCKDVDALTFEVPDTLRQFIAQQMQHLCPEDQALLEAASVAGVEFFVEAVAAALELPPEVVETRCDTLVRNNQFVRSDGIVLWPDGTMTAKSKFQHALYAEVLYERVPLSRRARWHHRMGLRLEAGYGAQAPEIAAELGEHFRRGRDAVRAVQYLQYAGENALQRHAYQETIRHLTQALALVPTLPDTLARAQQELRLRQTLSVPLVAIKGYAAPDVEQTYTRAYTLCQQVGDVQHMRSVLLGLWRVYSMRGALQAARGIAEQLLYLAQCSNDPLQLVDAHRAMGVVLFWLGDLTAACTHLEQGWTFYDRQQDAPHVSHSGPDVGVSCLSMATTPLWMLGYPDQAAARSERAIVLARELQHPFSLAFALVNAARLSHFRREWHVVQAQAEAIQKLATEHHFAFWQAVGLRWHGVALVAQGQTEEGIGLIRQGHMAYQANGTTTGEPYYRLLMAEAYSEAGQTERGVHVMREALAAFDTAEDRLYEAEVYRLKGKILLACDTTPLSEVETCFRQALAVARRQQAKSLELRAAMSLAKLGQKPGNRDPLTTVYPWFTEGFDTADLQEAKALLGVQSEGVSHVLIPCQMACPSS
jgi:predicted ATPase